MPRYSLVFQGELAEGVDAERCIQELAQSLKTDPAVIERNFFQHWPKTVVRTDDRVKADNILAAFNKAGARLEFHDEQSAAPASQPDPEPDQAVLTPPETTRPEGKRHKLLWGALAAALILGLLVGAGAWYTLPLWQGGNHPALARTEAALATPDLVLLGHLDARRAITIERRFLGVEDGQTLPGARSAFLDQLLDAGIAPRESVDLVVLGGYAAQDDVWGSGVVLGRFDPDAVRNFIESHYGPAPEQGNGDAIRFTHVDEETCERSPVMAASVTPDRIVVTRASQLESLLSRLEKNAAPSTPLESWRQFRGSRVASVGLFEPQRAAKASVGMTRSMLSHPELGLDTLDAAYLGFNATALPPGIEMTGALNSSNRQFLDDHETAFKEMLNSLREELGNQPEVASLFEHLRVFRERDQLGAHLRMDSDFAQDLQNLVRGGLRSLFAGSDMQMPMNANQTAGEQVAESPTVFHRELNIAELPAFTDIDDPHFKPTWSEGPVGLRIEEIGAASDQDNRIYITLDAQARELTNVADGGKSGRLRVTDVKDTGGRSVMPTPDCGRDRNQDPAFFAGSGKGMYSDDGEFIEYRRDSAQKRIVLAPEVGPEEVTRIEGMIELNLPVETQRRIVRTPLEGKSVTMAGARVVFGAGGGGTLKYESSGETDRILAVRPLNAKDEVLATRGSMAMDRMLGSGRIHSQSVQGTPEAAEVVIATRMEPLHYEFSLDQAYPHQSGGAQKRLPPKSSTRSEAQAALDRTVPPEADEYYTDPRARTTAGPVQIALNQLRTGGFYGFAATFDMRAALIPGLQYNLAAGRLSLSSATDASGEPMPLDLNAHFGLERDGMLINGSFRPDENRPYLEGDASLKSEAFEGQEPRSLQGHIELAVPLTVRREAIDTLVFGRDYTAAGVSVTPLRLQSGKLKLRVNSGRERLAGIEVLNADDQTVHKTTSFNQASDGGLELSVGIGDHPQSLALHVVTDAIRREYPFSLTLEEPDGG